MVTVSKLVYPAQIYWAGVAGAGRGYLYGQPKFAEICRVLWSTQSSIIDLFVQTPRNYLRGDVQQRCLGLRDPQWVIGVNAICMARRLQLSTDERLQALHQLGNIDFTKIINFHITHLLRGLQDHISVDAITSLLADDKLLKSQRVSRTLRLAAAAAWRASPSGHMAGSTLTQQVLAVNDWRAVYRNFSDGALRVALKLNGVQHSLRSKNFIAARHSTSASCRSCGVERETLGHVIGKCINTKSLVITRHDMVVDFVADLIRHPITDDQLSAHWTVTANPRASPTYEHYKPDLLVRSADGLHIFLLDPTVRLEKTDALVQTALAEKSHKYTPLIDYYKLNASTTVTVQGLYFGSRGILHEPTIGFLERTFGIDRTRLLPVASKIMAYTAGIYARFVSGQLLSLPPSAVT